MANIVKFIYYQSSSDFKSDMSSGNIDESNIVFIADEAQIWSHGKYFGISSSNYKAIETLLTSLITETSTLTQRVTTNENGIAELAGLAETVNINKKFFDAHVSDYGNPHLVTASQVGVPSWAQSDTPDLYIGTTKVQTTSTGENLGGILSLTCNNANCVTLTAGDITGGTGEFQGTLKIPSDDGSTRKFYWKTSGVDAI